jgi:hypothetical protein
MNPVIYRKLVAQAEEAKEQGMTKLAEGIMEAIGSEPTEELQEYSYAQLQDDVHRDMWKLATHVMKYYNLEYADVEKLDKTILVWASKVVADVETTLGVDSVVIGPLEPKVPGEDK